MHYLARVSEVRPRVAQFRGDGHLSYLPPRHAKLEEMTSFSLEMKTEAESGLLIWIGPVRVTYISCILYDMKGCYS